MSPILVTIGALLRRIGLAAGSGLLAYVIENYMGWLEQGFLADPKTAVLWPIIWVTLEVIQKYLREQTKV